jgi:3-deoxy-manno-octulosonate cytidylyltransferase (CMP-KDO synthetase)
MPPRVAIVIPARLHSTRLPEKMLADIGGKPLIVRTYEQAAKSKLADVVMVAADDQKIADALTAHGCNVMLTPTSIQTGTDRVAFVAKKIKADIFANVQGDEPLISPKSIDQAISVLIRDKSAHVGTLVKVIGENEMHVLELPSVVKVVLTKQHNAMYFSRSPIPFVRNAAATPTFYKHIGIYIFRKAVLERFTRLPKSRLEAAESLEQLRLLENGYKIACGITKTESQAVDTAEDLKRVREIFHQQQKR